MSQRTPVSSNGGIQFLLNNKLETIDGPPTSPLVDAVREHFHQKATKIGCREGDCGACTLLVGEIVGDQVRYRSVTSCIYPIGNAHGKHILSLEGLTPKEGLNPIQEAFASHFATQCGFCTPGFLMSISAAVLSSDHLTHEDLRLSIDGNLCRCTGYHSILRALKAFEKTWCGRLQELKSILLPLSDDHVRTILRKIEPHTVDHPLARPVGGGTDLLVQSGYPFSGRSLPKGPLAQDVPNLSTIEERVDGLLVGAGTKASDLYEHPALKRDFPAFHAFFPRIASTQIRNEATLAGNLVNASPIADFAIILLALEATLEIRSEDGPERKLPLAHFFKAYKQIDLDEKEWIQSIWIPKPLGPMNIEKVSKREILDIASVNTAASFQIENGTVSRARISAGGVAPIPLMLQETAKAFEGQPLNDQVLQRALRIAAEEISPISDIRGSANYKRQLLQHLIVAHTLVMAPDSVSQEVLWPS